MEMTVNFYNSIDDALLKFAVIGKTRVNDSGDEMYGMLYYADIRAFGQLPPSEIEKVVLFETFPEKWAYPSIQPKLIAKAESMRQHTLGG